MSGPVPVAVIHPSPAFRAGLASALTEAGYAASSEAGEVVKWVADHPGGVVFVGVDDAVWAELRQFDGRTTLVALTERDDPGTYQRAFAAGAAAVVTIMETIDEILAIVAGALNRKPPVPLPVLHHMAVTAAVPIPEGLVLSDMDVAALTMLAHGSKVATIAANHGYSEREMHRRLKELYRRIGVTNRAEALVAASRWDLSR